MVRQVKRKRWPSSSRNTCSLTWWMRAMMVSPGAPSIAPSTRIFK
jgi:hypothetical protein